MCVADIHSEIMATDVLSVLLWQGFASPCIKL